MVSSARYGNLYTYAQHERKAGFAARVLPHGGASASPLFLQQTAGFNGTSQGYFVSKFQIAAHRKATCQTRDLHP